MVASSRCCYWSGLEVAPRSEPRAVAVLFNVSALDLRYLDRRGQWHRAWPPAATNNPQTEIPAGIEVGVTLVTGERITRLLPTAVRIGAVRTARIQRGVAVVVAVLVVALATSTATYMLWQQSLWVRQLENITARAQADAIARAAASWAAAVLAEDNPAIDHLGELWARRLPPIAAEKAQVAGTISDEQAKFNVNNLAREGGVAPHDLIAFQRLLAALGLPAGLAEAVVDWLDPDSEVMQPNGAEDSYYLALDAPYRTAGRRVVDLAELVRVRGFDADILARLAPFVTALPEETLVNVNTAPVGGSASPSAGA